MLLVIDVGNTNITMGVYDGKNLKTTFRMMSKQPRTSDEYGITLRELLRTNEAEKEEIEGVIMASVVPNVMHSLVNGITKYIGKPPMIVGPGVKTGIRVTSENPREIGADRIVDVVAAYEKYGGPALVIDFGTATTYDLVTEDGSFSVGITAPGIRISAKALWEDTAKLPEIGYDNMKVVATGGLGRIIADETDEIQIYDRDLTLEGLRIIYEKNTDRRGNSSK